MMNSSEITPAPLQAISSHPKTPRARESSPRGEIRVGWGFFCQGMEDSRAARSAPNAGDGCGQDKCTRPESSIRTPGKFARLLLLKKAGPWSWLKEADNEFARRKGARGYFYILLPWKCVRASGFLLTCSSDLLGQHWCHSLQTPGWHRGVCTPKIPKIPAHRGSPPLTQRAELHHATSCRLGCAY